MENQPNSVAKAAMSYGLYLGLALILSNVIFYVIGQPFSEIAGYLSYVIIIAGIAWAMWTFGQKESADGFPYGRALGLGTLQALFASILVAFYIFILYKFIDPTLTEKLMAFTEEKMLSKGLSSEQVDSMMGMSKKMMTPTVMSVSQLFSLTIMGFLFSLILAIIFKKKPANPFQEVEAE